MKKVLIIAGTRPEIIKIIPVYLAFKDSSKQFQTFLCHTGQHYEMAEEILSFFDIRPDYKLEAIKQSSSLTDMSAYLLVEIECILKTLRPDVVVIHGDTNTTLAGAIAAFHNKIPVIHIEAGLRSGDLQAPWPEEMNRKAVAVVTKYHFAPTIAAKENLLKEGYHENDIFVVGNTVVDALNLAMSLIDDAKIRSFKKKYHFINFNKKIILFTGHRRENLDGGLESVLRGFNSLLSRRKDVEIIFPAHLNPKVQDVVSKTVNSIQEFHILSHLPYQEFLWLMSEADLIVTDSGGIQEEAPSLKKPVLVIRDKTERVEMVDLGAVKLIGAHEDRLVDEVELLFDNPDIYARMQIQQNPYGKGDTSLKIVEILNNLIS